MDQAVPPVSENSWCECGGSVIDAALGSEGLVSCQTCGRPIRLAPAADIDQPPANVAAPQPGLSYVVSTDPKTRIRAAAAYVNQGKPIEALALYKWVHDEDPDHRDALYGMGFCYYRMGYLERSKWLLERALELGHPFAPKLLRKVMLKLEPTPEIVPQEA